MLRRAMAVVAVGVAALLGGCVQPFPSNPSGSVQSPIDPWPLLRKQAADALARWDAAVARFGVPVVIQYGPAFGEIGAWEPAFAKGTESAAQGGFDLSVDLPDIPQPTTSVRFPNGKVQTLPMLRAYDAFASAPRPHMECEGCPLLRIIGATLGNGVVTTNLGQVTVPLWQYEIAGTSVRLTRPAVAFAFPTVTPPSWDSNNPPAGIHIESAAGSASGRQLTVTFTGARGGANEPCGSDYTAEAVESDAAIVVVILEHKRLVYEVCNDMGFNRYAVASLDSALGDRTVLEGRQGLPVPTARLA